MRYTVEPIQTPRGLNLLKELRGKVGYGDIISLIQQLFLIGKARNTILFGHY